MSEVIDSLAVGSDVVVQEGQNTPEKIQFRQNVLVLQEGLLDKISKGEIESTLDVHSQRYCHHRKDSQASASELHYEGKGICCY